MLSVVIKSEGFKENLQGLCASNAGGLGWIPGWGTRIPHAMGHSKKKNNNKPSYLKGPFTLPD